MKLKKITLLAFAAILTIITTACSNDEQAQGSLSSDMSENVFEHNFPSSDLSGYDIEGNHRFFDVTMYEALKLLEDATFDGVLYFGFPACPWCQAAMPLIYQASQETQTDVFYVSRRHEIRETKNWEIWDAEMAEWLDERIEMRWFYLDENGEVTEEITDEPYRPNIFVPQIIHIRNGQVIDNHRGTFDGHSRLDDRTLPELTDSEHTMLLEIYTRIFSGVNDPEVCSLDVIDDGCS